MERRDRNNSVPIQRDILRYLCFGLCALFASPVFACSCLPIGPPCQAAWLQADAVFVGRVYDSVLLPTKRDGFETIHRLVTVRISETFIGSESGWVTVETGAGGSDCGYDFSWLRQYLIYAHREKDGSLRTSICTRTQKIADAGDDLAYLRTLKGLPLTGRVYGTVKQYTFDPHFKPAEVSIMSPYGAPEDQVLSMRVLTGTTVKLTDASGTNPKTAQAAQNGEFSFEGLTPGRYRISVDLPRSMKPFETQEVIVPAKGCSKINVRTAFNGRVSGRVTDESGAAVPYIAVEVVRASEASGAERAFQWVTANKDGSFEIGPLPPDEYVVGVNITKYDPDRKKPTTYYPGTPDLGNAKKVRLGEGQLVKGLDFRLSRKDSSQPQ